MQGNDWRAVSVLKDEVGKADFFNFIDAIVSER